MRGTLLDGLGGEAGCRRLSAEFYRRVGKDPVLRPLFPGKSLRCATQEFAAFLIQFLGGDEAQTQHRWWLSLRESHARFRISGEQRSAWLKNMDDAIAFSAIDEETRTALRNFFLQSSAYLTGNPSTQPDHSELTGRWNEQLALDETIAAIAASDDQRAGALAARFQSRPSVYIGILARLMQSGRPALLQFAIKAVENNPTLGGYRYFGRTLLHLACGAGSIEVAKILLSRGADPNAEDSGGHTPLYSVANECALASGPELVRILAGAGADVNANGGVTRATPLHMAARRGFVEIAKALLESGAAVNARDSKGDTPLQRAINCRKRDVAALLAAYGACR